MNYEWNVINKKGNLTRGLFLNCQTKPDDENLETMITIHCFGSGNEVKWVSARFFFKTSQENLTDGFLHWGCDDVKGILCDKCGFELEKDLVMHIEIYTDVESFSDKVPLALGDYTFPSIGA